MEKQLVQKQLIHWETLSSKNLETLNLTVASLLQRLRNEFDKRFEDFKSQMPNKTSNPFDIEIESAGLNLHLELIEIQSNSLLKSAYND